MADPDSVMERSLEREGASVRMHRLVEELNVELEAHMAEMDRRLSERLEALMNEPLAFLRSGSVGMGKSMRARRPSALFAPSAADGLDDLEYLKSLTKQEPVPEPPRRPSAAQKVRSRRQQPARVPKR